MKTPILGELEPHWASDLLNTGYLQFSAECGVGGLAKAEGFGLDILAVQATTPGTGQFREFIRQCKEEYDRIAVWEIWNDELPPVLARYDFKPTHKTEAWGELITGMEWTSTSTPQRSRG